MVDKSEYVTKDEVISVLTRYGMTEDGEAVIRSIPSAEVAPIKHGEWYWDKNGMDWGIGAWRCSACKAMSPMWWNADKHSPKNRSGHSYCPVCGARMDG